MVQPAAPEGLTEAARKELEKNEAAIAGDKTPSFSVYSSPGVRDSLNDTFHRKCAYCESTVGPTQPVAVEHYRPKGKITISEREERTLGYYWLAGDWSNLLPSCTDCNSPRRHPVGNGPPQLLGKGNLFPISNETKRATKPGEEAREHRLLLHPYLDDPDEHLEFIDEGVVRPRRQKIRPSRMGAASIRVYGLQRPLLVEGRAAEQRLLLKQIARVKREAKRWEQDPNDAEQEAILREEVEALKAFVAPEHRYTGMVRQTLKAHSTELSSVGVVLGDL